MSEYKTPRNNGSGATPGPLFFQSMLVGQRVIGAPLPLGFVDLGRCGVHQSGHRPRGICRRLDTGAAPLDAQRCARVGTHVHC